MKPATQVQSLDEAVYISVGTQQVRSLRPSPTANTMSELTDQVELLCKITDSSGNLKHQQFCFLFQVMPETSAPNPFPHRANTPVPQTMDTRITSSHPTSNITQSSTLTQINPTTGIVQIFSTQPARFEGSHPSPKTTTPMPWGGGGDV